MTHRHAGSDASDAQGAKVGGKLLLEGVDVGAKRRNPVGSESVLDVGLFQAGHVGRRKVDALSCHAG